MNKIKITQSELREKNKTSISKDRLKQEIEAMYQRIIKFITEFGSSEKLNIIPLEIMQQIQEAQNIDPKKMKKEIEIYLRTKYNVLPN